MKEEKPKDGPALYEYEERFFQFGLQVCKQDKPSQWEFRTLPVYVIIPKGSANPENQFHLIPKEITVFLNKNNTVTWINEDDVPSTLVADDDTWQTGMILPGESSNVTFNQTGIFEYHGSPHPWKVGKVIVVKD